MKPNISIFDVETQEEVIREMTDSEYSQYLVDVAEFETKRAELDAQNIAKAAAKAEALAALGLSQEIINLLAD